MVVASGPLTIELVPISHQLRPPDRGRATSIADIASGDSARVPRRTADSAFRRRRPSSRTQTSTPPDLRDRSREPSVTWSAAIVATRSGPEIAAERPDGDGLADDTFLVLPRSTENPAARSARTCRTSRLTLGDRAVPAKAPLARRFLGRSGCTQRQPPVTAKGRVVLPQKHASGEAVDASCSLDTASAGNSSCPPPAKPSSRRCTPSCRPSPRRSCAARSCPSACRRPVS